MATLAANIRFLEEIECLFIFPPMRSFLVQPYPFSDNAARKLAVCGGIGIFIALFLAVFQPFGFAQLSPGTRWVHSLLFGAVTFAVSSLFQIIIPKIFPLLFKEESWRSWKEVLFLLFTTCAIGAGNFWLMNFLYPHNEAAAGFLKAQAMTLQVGIFPVIAVVFMKQLTLYRRFAAEAAAATQDIREEEKGSVAAIPLPQKLVLRGDGQKEELSFFPNELLFIASADNYVSLNFKEGATTKSLLMRSSLKKMEEQLADYSCFFRCHRMYLVNLPLVETVSGNAQGLKLHLAGSEVAVPVSRTLTEEVKARLHSLSHSPQNRP
jgi:hypothetical protein